MKILFDHKMEQLDALISEVKAFEISLQREGRILHVLIGFNIVVLVWSILSRL